jgi:hypothetical protein
MQDVLEQIHTEAKNKLFTWQVIWKLILHNQGLSSSGYQGMPVFKVQKDWVPPTFNASMYTQQFDEFLNCLHFA